jgi:hypothetical protein
MDITSEFAGGPGGQLTPWTISGATISYSGCVLVPRDVPGGDTGSGTINTAGLYINGVQFAAYQLPVASTTMLGGVKVDGVSITITNGVISASIAGTSGIAVGITPPPSPTQGALWWDATGGQLYVWYNDGNSAQWVTSVNQGFGGTYLPLAGGVLTGPLSVSMAVGHARSYFGQTLAAPRWELQLGDSTAEGGSDAGSNLNLIAYGDTGIQKPILNINRATGVVTHQTPLVLAADPTGPLQAATKEYVDNKSVVAQNRIINGDMTIDQRHNGNSATTNGYTVDRWQYFGSQASKGVWGQTLSGGSLTQFYYSLAFTSSSAYALLASDYFIFYQPIEGYNVNDFAWGTPQAQPVTLTFWAFSSISGTFGGAVTNYAGTRSYPFSYALVSNIWTKITIVIPGDTAGTWVMTGSAGSLDVMFDLGSGASHRGPANNWASANYFGATGTVSVVSVNAANFYVTGVKLEIGNAATQFQRQTIGANLRDCQRYYQFYGGLNVGGYNVATGYIYANYINSVQMRATPTGAIFGTPTYVNASNGAIGALTLTSFQMTAQVTANGGAGMAVSVSLNAEL